MPGRLRIVASGETPSAKNHARGKLFEELMAQVLRRYGYSIDDIPSRNYSGMEIDIAGRQLVTDTPLYAECKAYENPIDSPKVQAFFGKYMSRWLRDKRAVGLFVALPSLNSHAKAFYEETCGARTDITVKLIEEREVLESLFDSESFARPDVVAAQVPSDLGTPGDWMLVYSDRGPYWIQFLVDPHASVAQRKLLFTGTGVPVHDRSTVEFLERLVPELSDFETSWLEPSTISTKTASAQDSEEIVEVRGSSSWFEYQFPASPEFLVGREGHLEQVLQFADDVLEGRTSSRGLLFEANSGWGKSSVVLASVKMLEDAGHYAVAIDSRSASSSQFILHVAEHVLKKLEESETSGDLSLPTTKIGGFETAASALLDIGAALKARRKILFVFLDQSENLFFLPDALRQIRDVLLKVCDVQTNVVIGFSWKTDLVGPTADFPYQLRAAITDVSRSIRIDTFSETETNQLILQLQKELHARLRKDLTFFLSQFSQGYPWLLKKLCAHIVSLRSSGVSQAEIATGLLNVEELFQQDLHGLSADEEATLRQIARMAPIEFQELGEEFSYNTVQSLVNRRLVVRIGTKYDIYWDIFRDYLNTGRVPIQENYILRVQVGSISRALKILVEAGGEQAVPDFMSTAGLTEKSYFNVAKDMRLLRLITVEDGLIRLGVAPPAEDSDFEDWFRSNLRERLRRNRMVSLIAEELAETESLELDEVALILASANPYIAAVQRTWREYARGLADWMDAADLVTFESSKARISRYEPRTEVRERRILPGKRRGTIAVPRIQYGPIARALEAVMHFTAHSGGGGPAAT